MLFSCFPAALLCCVVGFLCSGVVMLLFCCVGVLRTCCDLRVIAVSCWCVAESLRCLYVVVLF